MEKKQERFLCFQIEQTHGFVLSMKEMLEEE